MWSNEDLLVFGLAMVVGWFLYVYFWPRIVLLLYKRAILVKGFGDGPIPVNTLHTEPQTLFADPLHVPASGSNLMTMGVNRDTLLTVGWLDLTKGPQILHVPDMAGRYYSVQFTDPSNNTNFGVFWHSRGSAHDGCRPGSGGQRPPRVSSDRAIRA